MVVEVGTRLLDGIKGKQQQEPQLQTQSTATSSSLTEPGAPPRQVLPCSFTVPNLTAPYPTSRQSHHVPRRRPHLSRQHGPLRRGRPDAGEARLVHAAERQGRPGVERQVPDPYRGEPMQRQ
jgi:hypothetical protein